MWVMWLIVNFRSLKNKRIVSDDGLYTTRTRGGD